jgi:hypothetical protein
MNDETLSRYERENLLLKLEKEFAFAGASIPPEIEVDGERIPLRAFVFGMSRKRGQLTPEDTAEVDRIIALLRKKRREVITRISGEELTKAKAGELFGLAMGLGRALDTLYNAPLPKHSIAEESRKAKMEDGRRWLNLVRKVYSGEEKRKRDQ